MIPVAAIFSRLTDGPKPRLNFPRDSSARAAFLPLAEKVLAGLGKHFEPGLIFKEQLMVRLGTHCVKYGITTGKAAHQFEAQIPDLIEAIAEKPELRTGATLDFFSCRDLNAPKLTFAHEIHVWEKAKLALPVLEKGVDVVRDGSDFINPESRRNGPWPG